MDYADRQAGAENQGLPYRLRGLELPHEQEVAAVVAGVAHVGIFRRLVGVEHHRAAHATEHLGPVHHRLVALEGVEERLGEGRMPPAALVRHRLQAPEVNATRVRLPAMRAQYSPVRRLTPAPLTRVPE